jgi:hypothetical protein
MIAMTCDRFEDRLSALMESDVTPAERQLLESHADACERCGPLLAEMRDLVRDAGMLPELQPSRDLWDGIAARIEAPVVELGSRQAPAGARRGPSWRLAAAAAAVLVALTAVTTWQLAGGDGSQAPRVATVAAPDSAIPNEPGAGSDAPRVMVPEQDSNPAAEPVRAPAAPRPVVRDPAVMNVGAAESVTGVYDREIASLRRMLDTRRGEFDTATVRVLEENLTIIDRAIEQSRQALARDPNSQFLVDHLNISLGRKVQLLRTVTLLPASS